MREYKEKYTKKYIKIWQTELRLSTYKYKYFLVLLKKI